MADTDARYNRDDDQKAGSPPRSADRVGLRVGGLGPNAEDLDGPADGRTARSRQNLPDFTRAPFASGTRPPD